MNLLNIYSMMHQPIHPSTHPSIIHISIQLTHTFMHSFLPQAQSCTHLISFVTFLSFIHKHLEFLYSPRFIFLFPSSLHWSRFFFFLVPLVPQSCPTLLNPVHWIFQARILEWIAISSSGESSRPKDWTSISCVSCIAGRLFTHWGIREAQWSS